MARGPGGGRGRCDDHGSHRSLRLGRGEHLAGARQNASGGRAGDLGRPDRGRRPGGRRGNALSYHITEANLPEGYEPVRSERFSSASRCATISALEGAPRSLRKTLSAHGLKRCEWTQYERTISGETSSGSNRPGALIYVLRDEQAASEFLPVLRRLVLATIQPDEGNLLRRHSFATPPLGDEALRGVTATVSPNRNFERRLTAWLYFWRRENVVAVAGGGDAVGDFNQLSALDLARAVDAQIAD